MIAKMRAQASGLAPRAVMMLGKHKNLIERTASGGSEPTRLWGAAPPPPPRAAQQSAVLAPAAVNRCATSIHVPDI